MDFEKIDPELLRIRYLALLDYGLAVGFFGLAAVWHSATEREQSHGGVGLLNFFGKFVLWNNFSGTRGFDLDGKSSFRFRFNAKKYFPRRTIFVQS